ncbi:uracil-DNA glycosylase superfamily protein [Salinisphaera sp. T31B1]
MRTERPNYHAAPVQAFGPADGRLLVVGLAPGMHGANATGRPFTGDRSGQLLFETLYRQGLCSAPVSVGPGDGLQLHDCRITNAVKCLPPGNRPVAAEINACNAFLRAEIEPATVVLALGGLAHNAVVRALGLRRADHRFGHDIVHRLPAGQTLIDSYHCSRYNINTGRLTPAMLNRVFARACRMIAGNGLPEPSMTP